MFTIPEFFAKMISSQPNVEGIAINKIVIFVPRMFRKTPEIADAIAAPSAIIATIQANSSFVTLKPLSSLFRSLGAAGLDQPRRIPKMNAPP